jgi:hypothetical protein
LGVGDAPRTCSCESGKCPRFVHHRSTDGSEQFFKSVLGNRLLAILSEAGVKVTVFFLGCGALARNPGSLQALREVAVRYVVGLP